MRNPTLSSVLLVVAGLAPGLVAAPADLPRSATPQAFVDTYDSLADTILGAKKTEWNLVHSILATTYSHAEAAAKAAQAKLAARQDAKGEIEALAALVSQIANEGDAAVARVRKRLLEGGHHHNAEGEKTGAYDEGFVIVTRAAKKAFLDAAGRIGRLGSSPDAAALAAEWDKVVQEFERLHATAR